ncbi:MAG: hypothetical protein AUH85_07350 [Chloroflexi bacterium 13_1_40CM_4_68_4]|nr:MAG: hypothetical protein AUH85_07350 [Chloroflexi bacterium 13_1_40CM_4_68_4]
MATDMNLELMLDGNAVGGLLIDVFGEDLTALWSTCPDCGRQGELATLHAFTHAPGVVLRCPACHAVLLRIATTPRGVRYDVRLIAKGGFPQASR